MAPDWACLQSFLGSIGLFDEIGRFDSRNSDIPCFADLQISVSRWVVKMKSCSMTSQILLDIRAADKPDVPSHSTEDMSGPAHLLHCGSGNASMYKNPARCTNYKPTNALSSSKMTPSHEATPSPHVIITMKKCNGRRTACCVLAGATTSKTSPVHYRQLYRLGLASCKKARKLLKHCPATSDQPPVGQSLSGVQAALAL